MRSRSLAATLRAILVLAGLGPVAGALQVPPAEGSLPAAPDKFPSLPGTWELSPDRLVAGKSVRLQLRYTHGPTPLPAGSAHIVQFEPLSVQDLLHARPSEAIAVVPVGEHELPDVVAEPMHVDGVGYGEVVLRFPQGLQPGDRFALDYGNRGADGAITALVAPIHAKGLTFAIYTELAPGRPRQSWLNATWCQGLPTVDLVADVPSRIRLFGPTLVATGARFRLRLAVTDAYDSRPEPPYVGVVALEAPEGLKGLPPEITLTPTSGSTAEIDGAHCEAPGIYRVRARLGEDGPWFESNPIVVKPQVEQGVSWGSLHNHTLYSEGWGDDLDATYAHARDVAGLDFFAVSDHYAQMPAEQGISRLTMWRQRRLMSAADAWADTLRVAAAFNQPGRFVTLVGYECSMNDSGHYNIYDWQIAEPGAPESDPERYFLSHYSDSADALKALLAGTHAIMLPHTHAAGFPYLTLNQRLNDHGEEMLPALEIYSDWGEAVHPMGERDPESRFGALRGGQSFLWALEQGHELGLIADADHHAGLTGRRQAFSVSPTHDHPPGLTAARLASLDREALVDAYRRRATYGTTGERIYLDVRAGESAMGEVHRSDGPVTFQVECAATAPIARIRLFDGLTLAGEWTPAEPGVRDATCAFECQPWLDGGEAGGSETADSWRPQRDGTELSLVPGSREERYYLARDRESVLLRDQRVTDGDRFVVYGFQFRAGDEVELEVDMDQEFLVSISHDGVTYQAVLEETQRVHQGGNRGQRRLDLTDFVREQPGVFLKFADSHPEDGWGARIRRLVVRSDELPEPQPFPELNVAYRYKERRHPFVVEVEQTDGHLAWSSPIWVERASLPDLRWSRAPDGRPSLTNVGNADAEGIEVTWSPDEHGFPLDSVAHPPLQLSDEVFLLWTERFDHRRTQLHARWYGSTPLTGRIVLDGVTGYSTGVNFDYRVRHGQHDDHRDGVVEFAFPPVPHDDTLRSVGLDFEVENDASRPNVLRLQLDQEVLIRWGDDERTCREFSLPLNGRRSDRSLVYAVIPKLAAGESWAPAEARPGFWSADPADRILERDEGDNLWAAD